MYSTFIAINAFFKQHYLLILLFVALFYAVLGFQFGSGNNVEELPVIYSKVLENAYQADPFIATSTKRFNAISLYTSFFGLFAKVFGIQSVKPVFFFFHLSYLIVFFSLLIALIKLVAKPKISTFFIFAAVLMLLVGEKFLGWMPNQRNLFVRFMDPMTLVIPFVFGSLYFFMKRKHLAAAFLLLIGSLIHPLYALPMAAIFSFVFIFSKLKGWKEVKGYAPILMYFLSVIPYIGILLYFSHETIETQHNATLIHEIIRAPHHLVIPSLQSSDRLSYLRFFELTFFLSILALILYHFKNVWSPLPKTNLSHTDKSENIRRLFLVLSGLLIYLLGASVISSFVRVDLLVTLTPYRMGTYTIAIAFILMTGAGSYLLKGFNPSSKLKRGTVGAILLLLTFASIKLVKDQIPKPKKEAIQWIEKNTVTKNLWLNYSDLDIRTNCYRSDYFQFKTIPASAGGQFDWYDRLCNYYAVPADIEYNYKAVRDHIKNNCEQIDLKTVLSRIKNKRIDYLLIDKKQKEFLTSIPSKTLFQNSKYEIYELSQ